MHKFVRCLLLLCFVCIAADAFAQTQPSGGRTVLFTCVDWDEANQHELYFYTDGDYHPIRLRENRRSRKYSYTGENIFRLYTRSEGSDGQMIYTQVAQLGLDVLPDRVLLLLTQGGEEGVRLYGIADTLEQFPPGSYNVINLTGEQLQITVDGGPSSLPEQGGEVIRVEGDPYRSLAVYISAGEHNLYSSTWIYEPYVRKVAFLLPIRNADELTGVNVRIIPEVAALQSPETSAR